MKNSHEGDKVMDEKLERIAKDVVDASVKLGNRFALLRETPQNDNP